MIIYTPIPKFNLMLATSPKCGCQTMKLITRRIFKHPYYMTSHFAGPTSEDNPGAALVLKDNLGVHATAHHDPDIRRRRFLNALSRSDDNLVLATRNPLNRLLSCYNYMILGKHRYCRVGGGKIFFMDRIEKFTKKPLYDISLTEFIDYIYNTPDECRDIHFQTQSHKIEDIPLSDLIKVESFKEDFQRVIDSYELPLVFPKHIQKNKTNYAQLNTEELHQDNLDKIYDIYKVDFKRFEYSISSPSEIQTYIKGKSVFGPLHQGPRSDQHLTWGPKKDKIVIKHLS